MWNYNRIKKRSGVTLVEMICVIAIIAVITGATFVSFTSLAGNKLEADARKIVSDINWAREMTVSTRTTYVIDFDVVNERYIIYRSGIAPNNEVKEQNLAVDLVSVVGAGGANLVFADPFLGSVIAKQINLSYQGRTKQINTYTTGYVKIQ